MREHTHWCVIRAMMLQSLSESASGLLGLPDPNSQLHFVRQVESRHSGHSEKKVRLSLR